MLLWITHSLVISRIPLVVMRYNPTKLWSPDKDLSRPQKMGCVDLRFGRAMEKLLVFSDTLQPGFRLSFWLIHCNIGRKLKHHIARVIPRALWTHCGNTLWSRKRTQVRDVRIFTNTLPMSIGSGFLQYRTESSWDQSQRTWEMASGQPVSLPSWQTSGLEYERAHWELTMWTQEGKQSSNIGNTMQVQILNTGLLAYSHN